MIVADTSLLANLLIPGLDRHSAEAVRAIDPEWHMPGLWEYEFRSVLLKYIRSGGLTETMATNLMVQASSAIDQIAQGTPDAVISAVLTFSISAYDAEYVALAQMLGVPLVTFDRKLARSVARIAFTPADYLARP